MAEASHLDMLSSPGFQGFPFLDFPPTLLVAVPLSSLLVPPLPSKLLKLECPGSILGPEIVPSRIHLLRYLIQSPHLNPIYMPNTSMLSSKLQTSISHCLFCVPTQISLETSPTFPKRNSAFPIAVKGNALPPVPTPLFLWNPLSNHLTLTADLQNVSRIQPFFTKLCLSHRHPLPNHYKSLLTVLPALAPAPYSPCQKRSRMILLKLKS